MKASWKNKGFRIKAKQKTQLISELDKNKDNLNDSSTIQINDDGSVQVVNKNGGADFEIDILEGAEAKMNAIIGEFAFDNKRICSC